MAWNKWLDRHDTSRAQILVKAENYLQEAMKDPTPLAHSVASDMRRGQGRHQDSITEATRAIALDANDPIGYYAMANALIWAGNPADGAEFIKKAMRLDPRHPPNYLYVLGKAQLFMGQYGDAAATMEEVNQHYSGYTWTFFYLAAIYGHLGREQEARSAIKIFNQEMTEAGAPAIHSLQWLDGFNYKERKDIEKLREGFRNAGVPERPSS